MIYLFCIILCLVATDPTVIVVLLFIKEEGGGVVLFLFDFGDNLVCLLHPSLCHSKSYCECERDDNKSEKYISFHFPCS